MKITGMVAVTPWVPEDGGGFRREIDMVVPFLARTRARDGNVTRLTCYSWRWDMEKQEAVKHVVRFDYNPSLTRCDDNRHEDGWMFRVLSFFRGTDMVLRLTSRGDKGWSEFNMEGWPDLPDTTVWIEQVFSAKSFRPHLTSFHFDVKVNTFFANKGATAT